jgi:DNA-binding NarL/FixJ family response regulator
MLKADATPRDRSSRNGLASPADQRSPKVPDDKPGRILIVEDDYFVATDLEHALTDAGFVVVGIAVTAQEAVDLSAATQPELAIMDIRLAGARDGIDAAADLLSRFGIRSVFASAHGDDATRSRAEKVRPLGWLTKPYSTQAAVETICKILRPK